MYALVEFLTKNLIVVFLPFPLFSKDFLQRFWRIAQEVYESNPQQFIKKVFQLLLK